MHRFKDLNIWKEGMILVSLVYTATRHFPDSERYGLTSQMNRAGVSVPSNIAEGAGRNTDLDFLRFLSISVGSCFELETQSLLAQNLGFGNKVDLENVINKCNEVQNKIVKFQSFLRSKLK